MWCTLKGDILDVYAVCRMWWVENVEGGGYVICGDYVVGDGNA